jgi:hypothetical protein
MATLPVFGKAEFRVGSLDEGNDPREILVSNPTAGIGEGAVRVLESIL